MSEIIDVAELTTSAEYQAHTAFWGAALEGMADEFRLRQNWTAYALPWGPEPLWRQAFDGAAADFFGSAAAEKPLSALTILLAGLFHVLRTYTGDANPVVMTPPLVRRQAAAGCLPLAAGAIGDGVSVRAYLNQVGAAVRNSYSYQDFPLAAFAAKRQLGWSGSNVLLCVDGLHAEISEDAPHDLRLTIRRDATLQVELAGDPEVFTRPFLQHLAAHWRHTIGQFAVLDQPMSELSLVDAAECERLLGEPLTPSRTASVLDGFAASVAAAPDSVAIGGEHGELSYAELDEQSTRLAAYLRSDYGLANGASVGLLADRSPRWVIGMLGIFKAGAVYVPLDPEHPPERMRFIIEDAAVQALLVHSDHLSLLTEFWSIPMFALDFQLATLEPAAKDFVVAGGADDPAYIIYTSGSTGTPKGVSLRHRGLFNMAQHHVETFGFTPADRLIQFYSPSFDGSLMEVFSTLLAGARLILTSAATIRDGQRFSELLIAERVTTLNAAPAYLGSLDWQQLKTVRTVISAGDSARVDDARKIAEGRVLHNSYGPTEASVCVTDYVVDPACRYGARIPIGKPIRHVRIYLLDAQQRLVPEGCIGELCIAGDVLATGYINRGELTANAFLPDPFVPGGRIYRSGDLAVRLPDGQLEWLGRIDGQVKIRGYRIELGEIEAVLQQHPAVDAAAVLALGLAEGQPRLVAYVAPATLAAEELRGHLAEHLPAYMLPAQIVPLEVLPLNANGKIDRRSLAGRELTPPANAAVVPPSEGIEAKLAAIWCELLQREAVGVHDNFFALGGDSILIIQTVARAHREGIKLTAQQHFEHPTIAALAALAEPVGPMAAEPQMAGGAVRLTPIQRWFFAQALSQRGHFNQEVLLEVPATLSPTVLRQAFAELVRHHDALRLAFLPLEGGWQQYHAAPPTSFDVRVMDLGNLDDAERQRRLHEAAQLLHEPFELTQPPLLRAQLFQCAEQPARLLCVAHHLVVDGVSWRILLEDLRLLCQQLEAGQAPSLPPKSSSYQAWSQALHALDPRRDGFANYWLEQAARSEPSAWLEQPIGRIGDVATLTLVCDAELSSGLLRESSRRWDSSLQEVLLAALSWTFREHGGESQLLVELEGHGREPVGAGLELSRTVGWFTAHYPLLLASSAISPRRLLNEIKGQVRAVPDAGLGYGVCRYLGDASLADALAAQSVAPIRFNYLGQTDQLFDTGAQWRPLLGSGAAEHDADEPRTHPFSLEAIIFQGCLRLEWSYNGKVHEAALIERLAESFLGFLRQLHASPDDPGEGDPGGAAAPAPAKVGL